MRTAALIAVAGAWCLACVVPVHVYEGPLRPEAELAIVESSKNTAMLEIDGKSVDRLEDAFALLPGEHTFEFRVSHSATEGAYDDGRSHRWGCFVTLDLEAGQRYRVREWEGSEPGYFPGSVVRLTEDGSEQWYPPRCQPGEWTQPADD